MHPKLTRRTLTFRPRAFHLPQIPPNHPTCSHHRHRKSRSAAPPVAAAGANGQPAAQPAMPSSATAEPTDTAATSHTGRHEPTLADDRAEQGAEDGRDLAADDPHGLLASYKTSRELADLEAGPKTALTNLVHGNGKSYLHQRKVRSFYTAQNATIEYLLKRAEEHHAEAHAATGREATRFKIAIWGSLVANIALSGLQVFAAATSGSLSLFTTMADSVFDPMSNITLIAAHRAIRRVEPNRFPAGRSRLETVGNIVFCFLMMTVGTLLIAFSVQEIVVGVKGRSGDVKGFYAAAVVAVCVAFATKLVLFLYCLALRKQYSQVRIVWQDHRNDLFINGFGILTSVGGAKIAWWIDPTGAIVLSLAICVLWGRTAFAEFMLLVGIVADMETQRLVTYVSLTHSPKILRLDTVRVYHSGPRLIAEVDVVMDKETPLRESHDVSEALQVKLETLPNIERAYVHVDYDAEHKPEHSYRKII
jgi:cation diffusion facilitator family transporter